MSSLRASFVSFVLVASLAACGGGGGGGGGPKVSPTLSTVVVDPDFGTPADGVSTAGVTVTILDTQGNPRMGVPVELRATGSGNLFAQPPVTDANGVCQGTIASSVAERKDLVAVAFPGRKEVEVGPVPVEFIRLLANTYFVRASGSDSNTGTAPLAAWRQVSFALTQVGAGDIVYVGAGTYDPIDVSTDADEENPLVLRGDPTGLYTGDAGEVILDAGGTGFGARLQGASFVTLRGFTIRGATAVGGPGAGVWLDAPASQDCSIVENSIRENVIGIDIAAATDPIVEANRISSNLGEGIRLAASNGVAIRDNLVYNNVGRGLSITGSSLGLSVGLNTFHANSLDQIHEDAAGSTGSIHENIVSEGSADGIDIPNGSSLTLSSNLAWANTAVAFQTNGGALPPSNVEGDPAFVDPDGADNVLGGTGGADDDFHVQASSPALDAGDSDATDVWLVTGAAAAQTTRFDEELDGQGADGDVVNLGYHTQVAVDGFAQLPTGRAVWARPDDAVVHDRTWTASTGEWGALEDAVATNREARWLVHRFAPSGQPDEILAELIETTSGTQLFVRHWDGRKWNERTDAPLTTDVPSTIERGFDVAFETPSGQALVVWTKDRWEVLPLVGMGLVGVFSAIRTHAPTLWRAGFHPDSAPPDQTAHHRAS